MKQECQDFLPSKQPVLDTCCGLVDLQQSTLLVVAGKSALVMKKGSGQHTTASTIQISTKISGIGELEVGGYYYRIRALKGFI